MSKIVVIDGEVTEDGCLVVQLPADTPRGYVRVTIEKVLDETNELDLTEEDLVGLGLTAEEIAKSPEIGIWADRDDFTDGEDYVEKIRHRKQDKV